MEYGSSEELVNVRSRGCIASNRGCNLAVISRHGSNCILANKDKWQKFRGQSLQQNSENVAEKNGKFLTEIIKSGELCKGVYCADPGESFHMSIYYVVFCINLFQLSIYLQKLTSIQPRTSPVKFARSPCTDLPGSCSRHTGRWPAGTKTRI